MGEDEGEDEDEGEGEGEGSDDEDSGDGNGDGGDAVSPSHPDHLDAQAQRVIRSVGRTIGVISTTRLAPELHQIVMPPAKPASACAAGDGPAREPLRQGWLLVRRAGSRVLAREHARARAAEPGRLQGD